MSEREAIRGGFCRDCLTLSGARTRCPKCASPRIARHEELHDLSIAHMDCDAFYAAVEKRDNPELKNKAVIIGGGKRGVVATACYIARLSGVRSAMPIFKARKLCPEAVILKPQMHKYREAGQQIRTLMRKLTPLVEPISIDEAFLDLNGTGKLHGASPALTMARLANRIETEIGITVSVGLSYNKFLAKVASDMNKPRGFSVIGKAEARDFLKDQPVRLIWGVGKALCNKLERQGITRIGQLQDMALSTLVKSYGQMGLRLYHLARGEDERKVSPVSKTKSISRETTFEEDIRDFSALEAILWPLCEDVASRARKADLAGRTLTLKLKTRGFQTLTRSKTLDEPTRMAEVMFASLRPMLQKQVRGAPFRLLGAGISNLVAGSGGKPLDLLDSQLAKRVEAELAVSELQDKFGDKAVVKGRNLKFRGLLR
jgi:DNA polymerase-4